MNAPEPLGRCEVRAGVTTAWRLGLFLILVTLAAAVVGMDITFLMGDE